MKKAAFIRKKTLLTNREDLNLRKKLEKCCIWRLELLVLKHGHRKVDQKFFESFEVW
jgi:hypothetical protein